MEPDDHNPEKLDVKVDEELYSRQLYVIGHEAMKKMMASKVLVIGLDGLGQEISKNTCLAGIKSLDLYDKSPVTIHSLCSGFFHQKKDLNTNKDIAALESIRGLNKYVKVDVVDTIELGLYDIVVSVNQTLEQNLEIGDICHAKKIKFVVANASGLFGQIFCDFQAHTCIDKNGESLSMGVINDITAEGILTLADGSSHSLEDGDSIKIDNRIYQVKVLNRSQLQLLDYNESTVRIGGDYEQVKFPFTIEFQSLRNALEHPEIMNFDFCNAKRSNVMHDLFVKGSTCETDDAYKLLERQFHRTRGCLIAPICSIIGGFAAQEVIKAASSKFLPVKQFYYFDSADAYAGNGHLNESKYANSRYHDMVRLFGEDGFEKIKALKVFLVGAGAIGCENLKNFVCSGLGMNGSITVTDMDSIEQSNLNRQFLFKEKDVSKMKSEAAVRNALSLNEDFVCEEPSPNDSSINNGIENLDLYTSLVHYTVAVNHNSEHIFTDKFIRDQDIISNALDNVEARAYMDERCIKMRKPLVDAGTLGTKGHVQVVIPFLSESYSSSTDPQEKSIPLCTIKSYPYSIEHTIEWAMSEFKVHFNEDVEKLKEYLDTKDPGLQEVYDQAPRNVEGCLKNALALFVNNYSTSIQNLLNTFPADHVDSEGNLFWSPPKKVPSPISFNINDKLHILFVESCANLFAECHAIRKITREEVYAFLENVLSLKEPNPIHFDDQKVNFSTLVPLEFDKDSWHADFIYACANLRARNYKIKERSKHYIRGIAGRIIPAIATTTAIVSGLATMEIIKYATKRDSCLNDSTTAESCKLDCKNSYLDLASPFLASTDLVKPKNMYYECHNKKTKYNIWSRLEIPDATLQEVIKKVEEKVGIGVGMVSVNSKVVFWDICSKYNINLPKRVSELCNKKEGQLLAYIDVLPKNDADLVNVAVMFED